MKVILVIFNALILGQVVLGDLVSDLRRNRLTELLDLIEKAGIAGQLQEPLTIFAPSNRAIQRLPREVVQALGRDVGLLRNVLLFHVIPGQKIESRSLGPDNVVNTAEGSPLRVNVYSMDQRMGRGMGHGMGRGMRRSPKVTANGVRVSRADVSVGDRSIVHVIDDVLPYPPPKDDIPTVLRKRGNFNTLLAAVGAADLAGALSNSGATLTLFAPNDDAFAKIPEATLNSLLQTQNVGNLTAILTRHVLPQVLYSSGIRWKTYPTLNPANMITTQVYRQGVVVRQKQGNAFARVVNADLAATNGVIHEIDTVI